MKFYGEQKAFVHNETTLLILLQDSSEDESSSV